MTKDIYSPIEGEEVEKPKLPEITIPIANREGVSVEDLEPIVEITSEPLQTPTPEWDKILEKWGYDPDIYEIVEPVKVSNWNGMAKDGEVVELFSYKAGVRIKSEVREIDFQEILDSIKKHKKHKKNDVEGATIVIPIGDLQIGKNDGDGTKGIIERYLNAVDGVEQRIKELRKIGRPINQAIIAFMGDLFENCEGSYPSQPFNVEWNRRQQARIIRRLARDIIIKVAVLVDDVVVLAVPGNHGENKSNGRVFTTPGDNDDVAVIESLADAFALNKDAFGHIKFIIPEDEIYVIRKAGNKTIGFAHGHINGSGASPQKKILDWWEGQTFGGQDIGFCDVLVTGHYHHLSIIEYNNNKTHIQIPALENESTWWKNLKGQVSPPGVLTFVVDKNGYKDFQVL